VSQQGLLQQSIRDATGTTDTFNGDWEALFDLDGIADGAWNERLLGWINLTLSAAYDNLPGAQAAFAANQGADTWNAIGSLSTLLGNERITEDGSQRLTEAGDIRVTE
jgi:hypothetical protein